MDKFVFTVRGIHQPWLDTVHQGPIMQSFDVFIIIFLNVELVWFHYVEMSYVLARL